MPVKRIPPAGTILRFQESLFKEKADLFVFSRRNTGFLRLFSPP